MILTVNISAFSLFLALSALTPPVAVLPFFLEKPLDKVTANEGDSISLLCLVGGTPEPEVEWFKHGGDLPLFASVSPGSRLTISSIELDDSGRYQCSAVNFFGELHHVFEVTVKRKN